MFRFDDWLLLNHRGPVVKEGMTFITTSPLTYTLAGEGDTVGKNPNVSVTPVKIATAAVVAANAGALSCLAMCALRRPARPASAPL